MMGEVVEYDGDVIGCLGDSDVEEEFCSCCAEDEKWQEGDEPVAEDFREEEEEDLLDEFSTRLFFKGVSGSCLEEGMQTGIAGIGVVMERCPGIPSLRVQKKLGLYVEELVAEHLALMDGLLEALRNGVKKVYAFTDSDLVYHQISGDKRLDDQLLGALGQRILELTNKLELFALNLVPTSELKATITLAQEAAGLLNSGSEAKALPPLKRFHCPFSNCSELLDPCDLLSTKAGSSSQLNPDSVECPGCQRLVCMRCHVPWHVSMSCEEYQNNPQEWRDSEDDMLHHLAQGNNWRRCEQCLQVIDFVQGCYRMTCWCGHEFCYSCGSEYRGGQSTCHCAYHVEDDDESQVPLSNQDLDHWRWESFDLPFSALDAYTEQERSQLVLIQKFLAGGIGLSDLNPCQSPPRCSDSFVDTIKDLHQLPWLERFVSVISDNYHEDYIQ